jgi:aspartate-semialdehyde dehydrogenase
MVGSVLIDRMINENDFSGLDPLFYSTSQAGQSGPDIGISTPAVEDAHNIDSLREMDVIISCQGGGYTESVHPALRQADWNGYWIDAASTLRMKSNSVIVLDPVNRNLIDRALNDGTKDYIGGNCTVSLMLMALAGLFENELIEWLSSMTYQAASGAGAKNMRELVLQMQTIGNRSSQLLADPNAIISNLDNNVIETLRSADLPSQHFGVPLAASLIPWIDRAMDNGQTKEEWKGFAETNKILGRENNAVPIDGQCVRIGAMRCHSQAFTIKLTRNVPLADIESMISEHNQWVQLISNEKEATLKELTPARISGTLRIPIGRMRKLNIGPEYITAFTVGDQLLWGAAEPLRRMLKILVESN